ncbi:MAG: hypothetical protein ACM3ML_37945 [Micromonosporaceae bacterium]
MKLAAAHRTRAAAIALGLVLLAGLLLLGTHGCATSVAVQSSAAPPGALSLAAARQVFNTFVTTDDVARAAGDERLELTLVNNAQVPLTVATYETAAYFGTPVPRYVYGTPRLYVPQMTGFPFWFAAVVRRAPLGGGPARTAIMVFTRPAPDDSWQLSLSTLLLPGATLPPIAVDGSGHATALATFDHQLLVTPNSTGALQATVAEQGSDAPAAALIAPGPYTTGLHREILIAKHREIRKGLAYDSLLDGTTFPLYALRTTDGGGLILYSLNRNTVILRKGKQGRQIEIPQAFAPVLDAADNLVIRFELDTTETYQFATKVPAKRSGGAPAIMRVIAADGGPTNAGGN